MLAGLLLALPGCEARDAAPDREDPAGHDAPTRLALGVDVLLGDSLRVVEGRRVGLITNHTGVSWPAGLSTIDRLHRHPDIDLVALYSPEHGIRGEAGAGETVDGSVDAATGLPIHSLYGSTRKPTAEMLTEIDVLVFDIQDIGARYYTYVWTMALAMEAAGEAGLDFVVLDRPNPIGGEHVQGNVLDPEFATFVGLYPVPMRHGLTAGELARMLVGEYGVDVDLTVVPMEGWTRRDWWLQTGLPFIPPSPNMPSVASATHYPGTCLFEGTNLSVGRGTDRPFQWIGAPWLDARRVAERLNAMVRDYGSADAAEATGATYSADATDAAGPDAPAGSAAALAGFYVEPTVFTPSAPGDGKFAGREVAAIRFQVTDPRTYDPTRAAVAALSVIHDLHARRLAWNVAHFDRLAGTDALREGIIAGMSLGALTDGWDEQVTAFEQRREPYLLYR